MKKIILLSLIVTFLSCTKQDEIVVSNSTIANKTSIQKAPYLPPVNFDWENAQYISYKGNNLLLPWESGANSGSIPKEICDDFKSVDGWVLLYNDFSEGQTDPKFMLYNKFKGIVKVYLYVTNSTYTASSFTWGFGANTIGCQTSTFNFTKSMAEPLTSKYSNPSAYIVNYSADPAVIPNGVNPNYWYCCQLEVMYDPNITNLTHDNIDFRLQCFATDKKYVKLDGGIDGTLNGTFTMPSGGSTSGLFSDLVSSFDIGKIGKLNLPTLGETQKFLTGYITKQTNTALKNSLTQGLTELSSSLLSTNPIINTFTNGLLSIKSSSPGKINCALKATINQSGTITSSIAGPSAVFKFPGTLSTNLGGILPNYDKPLGVFCVDKKPKINVKHTSRWHSDPKYMDGGYYSLNDRLDIDLTSFTISINPEVSALCSDITISKQIVFKPSYQATQARAGVSGRLIDSSYGYLSYLSSTTSLTQSFRLVDDEEITSNQCTVRISISLTPIGQSNPIIIIKEFETELVAI